QYLMKVSDDPLNLMNYSWQSAKTVKILAKSVLDDRFTPFFLYFSDNWDSCSYTFIIFIGNKFIGNKS
ncbi:MAG: hypothetical protein QXP36_14200, partial [Conexivisphaerales archaeon]